MATECFRDIVIKRLAFQNNEFLRKRLYTPRTNLERILGQSRAYAGARNHQRNRVLPEFWRTNENCSSTRKTICFRVNRSAPVGGKMNYDGRRELSNDRLWNGGRQPQ